MARRVRANAPDGFLWADANGGYSPDAALAAAPRLAEAGVTHVFGLGPGGPGVDNAGRRVNPDFVLNDPRYSGASILLARENFGCGSSREHAPWALQDFGIRVIIAPSFADIFFNNCFKNGVLPIALDEAVVDRLFRDLEDTEGYRLDVDLPAGDGRFAPVARDDIADVTVVTMGR